MIETTMRTLLLASSLIIVSALLLFHLPQSVRAQAPIDTPVSTPATVQSNSSELLNAPAVSTALTLADCVPTNHQTILNEHVINTTDNSSPTVQGELEQLQAQCTASGWVRPTGQRVQLYTLGGCYGWTADKIKTFTGAQQPAIQKLEQQNKYLVLEVGCNPNTLP